MTSPASRSGHLRPRSRITLPIAHAKEVAVNRSSTCRRCSFPVSAVAIAFVSVVLTFPDNGLAQEGPDGPAGGMICAGGDCAVRPPGGGGGSGGGSGGLGGPGGEFCSGDCCDECDPNASCPPPGSGGDFTADPVSLPDGHFVLTETDFAMVDRGHRIVIQRTHIGGGYVDETLASGGFGFGRNTLFGRAWNSTLQMYSYWGYDDEGVLNQRVNLGGAYIMDLPDDPYCYARPEDFDPNGDSAYEGCFAGPGSSHWYRFATYASDCYWPQCEIPWVQNPGDLTARDGMTYHFGTSCSSSPSYWRDAFVKLLTRKENRYGQEYYFYYAWDGTCGDNDVFYLLQRIRTPSGRYLILRYDPNSPSPDRPRSIDLTDGDFNVVKEEVVAYDYIDVGSPSDPNYPILHGLLKSVRKGCDCGGGGSIRSYDYEKYTVSGSNRARIARVRDGYGRVLLEVEYDDQSRVVNQVVGDPNDDANWAFAYAEDTPEPNWTRVTVTNPRGNVSVYTYDDEKRLVDRQDQSSDPNEPNLVWGGHSYNGWRGLTNVTRPDDANVAREYDQQGRQIRRTVQDPNDPNVTFSSPQLQYSSFEEFSQITKRVDPTSTGDANDPNICWTYHYDAFGSLEMIVGPRVTQGTPNDIGGYQSVEGYYYAFHGDPNHRYDPNHAGDPNYTDDPCYAGNWGLPEMYIDPNGTVTKFEYNEYGYLTKRIVDYGRKNLVHAYEPDDLGRTEVYTDPNGAVTQYEYNSFSEPNWIAYPDGTERRFTYDPNTGFLEQEAIWAPNQDANDPNMEVARTIVYVRDLFGRVTQKSDTDAGTTYYEYDGMGRLEKTTTPRGVIVEQEYDDFGRLEWVKEQAPGDANPRKVAGYTYDVMSRVKSMTRYDHATDPNDPNGIRTTGYDYNAMGWVTKLTQPDGTTVHNEYDAAGRVLRRYVMDPNGIVSDTTYDYDELGRVWKQRDRAESGTDDPNDRIVVTRRRPDGKVVSVKTGLGVTAYEYDTAGRLESTTMPDGTEVEQVLDDRGDVTQRDTIYGDGTVQSVTYNRDGVGRVTSMVVEGDPNGSGDPNSDPNYAAPETTSFTYYPTGEVKTRTDPNGQVTHYEYDAQGRVLAMAEDYGGDLERWTDYFYTDSGDPCMIVFTNSSSGGAVEQTTQYGYDSRGNVTWIHYPGGDEILMTYDLAGRVLSRSVTGGQWVEYAYNGRGLLATRTGGIDPNEPWVDTFAYDALGRMLTATRKLDDAEKSKVTFVYDGLGRLESESLTLLGAVTKTVEYGYDTADRRTYMKLPGGEEFGYGYVTGSGRVDAIARGVDTLVEYDYLGPAVSGRQVTLDDDPTLRVDWVVARDSLLRMTGSGNWRMTNDPNHWRALASYGYARKTMGIPTAEAVTPLFDTEPATRTFGYDGLNRLTGVAYPSGPNEVFSLDLAGNRTGICKLRSGEEPNYHEADVDNQYVMITPGETDPNYDAAGNLATDHRGYTYSYDHDNRLVRVYYKPEGGSTVVDMRWQYDALGRRIVMQDWTQYPTVVVVRYYMYSGQNVVEEYDGTTARLRYFVHGPTYIDERVVMHDDASDRDYVYLMKDLYTAAGLADDRGWPVELYDYDAYGGVVMQRCAAMPYAADFDGDGDVDDADLSVFASHQAGPGTEPNGVAGWRADLDCDGDVDGSDYVWFAHAYAGDEVAPRGDEQLATGPMAVSRSGNPYFFTGRRLDALALNDANTPHHFTDDAADLQVYYYRARTTYPTLGRFLQRDPLGMAEKSGDLYRVQAQYEDGMNLYQYVRSRPLSGVDPTGLCCCLDSTKKSGGVCMVMRKGLVIMECEIKTDNLTTGETITGIGWWPFEEASVSTCKSRGCTKTCLPVAIPVLPFFKMPVNITFPPYTVPILNEVMQQTLTWCRISGTVIFKTCCKDKKE